MEKERISDMSGAILVSLSLMTNVYSVMPGVHTSRAVWVSDIVATGFAGLCIWALCSSCDRFPDDTFFGVIRKTFGRFFGAVPGFVFAIFSLFTCAVSLTVFSRFVQITSLSRTPQMIIPLMLILVAAYTVKGESLTGTSKTAWLLVWFCAAVFVLFVVSSLRQIKPSLMLPREIADAKILTGAGEVFLNRFGQIPAFMAVYTRMSPYGKRKKYMISSVLVSGIVFAVISAISLATLGVTLSSADFYPVHTAMSLRSVGGFIRHTEILASATMMICLFFKGAVCLIFATDTVNDIFKTRDGDIAIPLALITASATQLIYRDLSSLRGLLEWKSSAWYMLALCVFLPAMLFVATYIKKKIRR